MKRRKPLSHQQMNSQNYRYKKKVPPTDEYAHLNSEVKIIKPADKLLDTRKVQDSPTTKGSRTYYIPKHIRDIMREED
jgi:hypothetical protein